ncbi:siderophore-interacting protein [Streptomyces nondiastaticus]|uniref:siderophore-interacting protein n=1 Tax=Streptomyces nondiastaticus TaxID=3154512 RepID=UPI00342A4E57
MHQAERNGYPGGRRFRDERLLEAKVTAVRAAVPGMTDVTLRGHAFARFACKPGAHLPVEVPGGAQGPVLRTYSVWRHTPADASLTLRIALHHPGGPGCAWAAAVTPGERVRTGVPRNRIVLDPRARHHVFVGEETGAVPLLTMLDALPPGAVTHGVLETTGPEAEFPAPDGARTLRWVHRGRASAAASPVLVAAVRRLELPPGPGVAYVAGEAATCRAVVRHFVTERGWPRFAVKTQTHWTPGKCGIL